MVDDQTKFVDIGSYSIHTKISVKHIYKFYCKPTLTSFMILKEKNPYFSLNLFLQFIIKDIKMKSLTITTSHHKKNQDKVKSLACLQPVEKKKQICSGETLIFIPDEANKSLNNKNDPLVCLLNISGLSTYLSFVDRHL